ncbi:hypothetical protein BKA58DRAFT_381164 [Alternaria rosae]|uniref:uncharacterized protein n=1 Tax=Alternaria rosae TaxID=1187941 RepID=UPI001E8EC75F|nr:uncharacterized protein BKA58DRAFT_381164 [Alternaria rosae]KAH6876175.1 hypothetical protein BKA58DRAFT_381164 [Alternaria rosae]
MILDGEAAKHEQAAIEYLCLRKSRQQAEKDWRSPNKRRKAIDVYLKEWSFDQSRRHWNTYRAARLSRGKDVCPALDVDLYAEWDDRSLNCYKGLTRAQSTMLLHMRTSTIGLNAHLHKLKLSDTAFCTCSRDRHTAKHLFLDCHLLSKERAALSRAVGHLSFKDMLTKDAFEATRWAIMHFDLAQWRSAKREAPNWKAPEVKKPKKKSKKSKSQPDRGVGGAAPPGLAAPGAGGTTST